MQNAEQLQSVVYFLSDHLCSAIDVGEEIYHLRFASQSAGSDLSSEDILDRLDEFHQFLDEIRTYEFMLLTKINQARHWCIHLRHLDSEFKPVIDLFNASTRSIADIETVLGIDEQKVFDGEGSSQHIIESRCLVVDEVQGQSTKFSVDDGYLLGGKVPLADLLDACNSFLDSMDIRYGLSDSYDDASENVQTIGSSEDDKTLKLEVNSKS